MSVKSLNLTDILIVNGFELTYGLTWFPLLLLRGAGLCDYNPADLAAAVHMNNPRFGNPESSSPRFDFQYLPQDLK